MPSSTPAGPRVRRSPSSSRRQGCCRVCGQRHALDAAAQYPGQGNLPENTRQSIMTTRPTTAPRPMLALRDADASTARRTGRLTLSATALKRQLKTATGRCSSRTGRLPDQNFHETFGSRCKRRVRDRVAQGPTQQPYVYRCRAGGPEINWHSDSDCSCGFDPPDRTPIRIRIPNPAIKGCS